MILFLFFCLFGFSLPYFDRLLIKNDFSKRYSDLRVSGQLEISHFFFKLTTERFNRRLTSFGHRFSTFSGIFYRIGTCFVLILFVISIPFLWFQIFKILSSSTSSPPDAELIVPGVNRPLSHVIHVLFAIIISVVLHEIGHAFACIAEGGSIHHVGVLSFAVLPGAFVNMDLERVANWGRVRIFCAGIWHNILICAICLLLRHEEINLTGVLFEKEKGLTVTYIDSSSSISGSYGLQRGDVIISANEFAFSDHSFADSMVQIRNSSQTGFCENMSNLESPSSQDCCHEESLTDLCFRGEGFQVCLHARSIFESSQSYCHADSDCADGFSCLVPKVNEEIHERLVIIERDTHEHTVLFVGDPFELIKTVSISPLVPKYFISAAFVEFQIKLLEYIFNISLALAFFNSLPSVALDGNLIVSSLVDILLPLESQKDKNLLLRVVTVTIGTFSLGMYLLLQFIFFALHN
ncbi:unnamed protein product [Oikopleura dioica]|uniref:Membrane-bound transcription factor site-2 protease n=1 Tax=Oikopleura dioica TaxID=34765 RepID=E4XKG6_OIKDI|nr:unnamed protein product [Oikopleura dioica]